MDSLSEITGFVLVMLFWFALLIGNRIFAAKTWRLAFSEVAYSASDLRRFSFGRFVHFLGDIGMLLLLIGFAGAPFFAIYVAVERFL